MSDHMKYWNAMSKPPLTALKSIKGGRLSGMSNISPQWRWKIMTEQFGMIGFGWKYTIEKRFTSPGANEEQFCFVEISLFVNVDGKWSDAIPGAGGSKLVSKEKGGLYNNDEAFKMAETDAVGTAMAKLGVGAEIYLGNFDGSKYNEPHEYKKKVNSPEEAEEVMPKTVSQGEIDGAISVKELKLVENVEAIKAASLADIPTIMKAIGSLDQSQSYTIKQVAEMLTEKAE